MKQWLAWGLFTSVMTTACYGQATNIVPFVAHRAVYDLDMAAPGSAKGPGEARGRIAFDFTGSACEGYVTNFRQVTEMVADEGNARVIDTRSNTVEGGDGRSFRFKILSNIDGAKDEDIDGKASVSADKTLSVQILNPTPARSDLGQDVLFPTDHLKRIIAAAKQGETKLAVKVFDGSDGGKKIFETLTVIGKKIETPLPADMPGALSQVARWPVTISYVSVGKKEDEPDYTVSFELLENGIAHNLNLDYGQFALKETKEVVELLPPAKACAP